MKPIIFFDIETESRNDKILDIGAIQNDGRIFHAPSLQKFIDFSKPAEFICGHNILRHDLLYIQKKYPSFGVNQPKAIDTLYLSPLLFPTRPYHHLLKDDKIQVEELNNPVNDSLKAKNLFEDELIAFEKLPDFLKNIYFSLLKDKKQFRAFFEFLTFAPRIVTDVNTLIKSNFQAKFCTNADLQKIILNNPIELAYCLALINSTDRYSITPPWVLINYPEVERILFLLRNSPCLHGCQYCDEALDATKALKDFFGFNSFRKYDGVPLQKEAVNAAVQHKSLLAVFPTGGGKSLTFQIPALMAGRNAKGLTVIISPLQSLMKDQVDNLEKNGITEAVTINGLLDPIERAKSIERVKNGQASILYISPESLRSKTIERLLLGRNIARFVVDEAHCFSAWGQDFRVDYLYIGDFIKRLQEQKNLTDSIPVSCFTATAKQKVIEDICAYFEEKLSLHLQIFSANSSRKNLHYKIFNSTEEEDKYNHTRRLIESNDCPTIIYVSRTRKAFELANRLQKDGYNAKPYHGKMDAKEKTENQNAFMSGQVQIMVATSAFGMGVDKKDIGMVIHYEISNSLENYVQEAGRAGRDENILADCYVLFNEEDLSKHFILLNQTKLSVREIQQIWRAIKNITKFRSTVSNSALEIARAAGWDDNVVEIETRVTTAIAALEQAGYLKRGQNAPRIFANSILSKNAQQAIEKINASSKFSDPQKVNAIRIIKKLFSTKSKRHANDEVAEARIDYISDHLGIVRGEIIKIITLLRAEKILADTQDLTAFIRQNEQVNRSLLITESFAKIENFLLPLLHEQEQILNIKELNEQAFTHGCDKVSPHKIKEILNFWAIKNWIKRHQHRHSKNHLSILCTQKKEGLLKKQSKRHELSKFIINYLFKKSQQYQNETGTEILVEFSVLELKEKFEQETALIKSNISIEDIEDTLFYLSRIGAIKIEGGFLVVYNKLTIDRLEKNNQIQYKKEDYQQLDQFYQNKIQQIHIVGEYANKMLKDYEEALKFVEDYFQLNYSSFLKKYFPGSRKNEIKQNITPKKFKQLFGALSPRQLQIIRDNDTQNILVAAGPGSGKTRVLVHKLASLLLMEDVKHEQLLMLTFSRAAATEFKKRLMELIGNAANFIEIKTFHAYCFDLLGRVGNLEQSAKILQTTIQKIKSGEVEATRITKSVLVIDEAQDMDGHEYGLIQALMKKNDKMRIIAVGDDDQNIYTFRGADSKYFEQFLDKKSATKYELVENYRSKKNLVEFTNEFVKTINRRLKSTPVIPVQKDRGNVRIIRYKSKNLIVPLTEDILATDLVGTTAVLTKTNEEALQITGLLLKHGLPAKLIQSNDGFNLFNLLEIRSFYNALNIEPDAPLIAQNIWNNAKRAFARKYANSPHYPLCKNLFVGFQQTNNKRKYKSDFEVFIRESRLEDFSFQKGETINVSTIHKAKGWEFDNVFLMLSDFNAYSDEKKRQLYVAMTRAKQNLFVHLNGSYLNYFNVQDIQYMEDTTPHSIPKQLILQLSHKDLHLSYFASVQPRIDRLQSGESLAFDNDGLLNQNGELIARFSKKFRAEKTNLEAKGFRLSSAKVNFIFYWINQDQSKAFQKEIKIILPELCFSHHFAPIPH